MTPLSLYCSNERTVQSSVCEVMRVQHRELLYRFLCIVQYHPGAESQESSDDVSNKESHCLTKSTEEPPQIHGWALVEHLGIRL